MVSACAWRVAQRSLDALGGFGIHEDNDRGRKPHLRARGLRRTRQARSVRARPTVSQSVMKMPLRLYSPGTGMVNKAMILSKIKVITRVLILNEQGRSDE